MRRPLEQGGKQVHVPLPRIPIRPDRKGKLLWLCDVLRSGTMRDVIELVVSEFQRTVSAGYSAKVL